MNVAVSVAEEDFSFMTDSIGRWVDRVLGQDYRRYRPDQAWSPAINLYENPTDYHLVADLAGVESETIDLRVEQNRLVLRGDRPCPRPPNQKDQSGCAAEGAMRLYHMEIDRGRFMRTVDMPESIDGSRVEASYRNGFLWVKIPKKS